MIEVSTNTEAFASSLDELQRRMSNLRPVMQSIGTELESRIANRIEQERDPAGRFWAGWSESYRTSYPQDGRGKLMQRYGDLISSLNWQAGNNSVRVGFGVDYSTYHEFGTDRMPRRGLLFANPEAGELSGADEQAVTDLLQDWLDGLFD